MSWDIERIMSGMNKQMDRHHIETLGLDRWEQMFSEGKAAQALDMMKKEIDGAVGRADAGIEGISMVYAMCDGPHPLIHLYVINTVGKHYPGFEHLLRIRALRRVLGIFDGRNCRTVQDYYMPEVHDPLLVGDLCSQRRHYWPGYFRFFDRIKKYDSQFFEFQKELMTDDGKFKKLPFSNFLFALAALHTGAWHHAEDYERAADKPFLNEVAQGVVHLFAGRNGREGLEEFVKDSAKPFKDNVLSLNEDCSYLERVEQKMPSLGKTHPVF